MKEKYIEDIKEIKVMMDRSTRFISLSGLSGVSTGIIALVGVLIAYLGIFKGQDYLVYDSIELISQSLNRLLLIAIGTLVCSIVTAILFTRSKINRENQSPWDKQTKRLLINLLIPLFTGGILCLTFLLEGFVGLLPPLTLIFYGLALVNGSKYALPELRTLGLFEIITGLVALQFVEYGLLFWAFGFGLIQIVYGIIVQKKYDK